MVNMRQISSAVNDLFGQVGMTHRFSVVMDHDLFELGEWQRVSGLSVTWEPCEFRTGDMGNDFVLYPGKTKYDNIKLARAACGATQDVQDWLGEVSRSWSPISGAIALHDYLGFRVVEWEMRELFPIAWSISDFDAGDGKVAVETLQVAHTGFLNDKLSSDKRLSRRAHW
ncbi:phage tail protein [Lentzea sp. NPDC051208]|uniref:phage tail protein n=1 Tax=Lentzea sp. NPDC051208 TaxID=3154642 RepID=UPI00343D479F